MVGLDGPRTATGKAEQTKAGEMEANMNHEYFECICHSPEHLMVWGLLEEDDYAELYATVYLGRRGFFGRLWLGLRYVLGWQSRYGEFCEFEMNPEDADRFIALIEKFRDLNRKGDG